MLPALFAAARLLLARLNPQAARWGGALLALALLGSLLAYEWRVIARHHLAGQQARDAAAHATAQAAARTRYARYQLDSTARATERGYLLRNASLLQSHNEDLFHRRPAPVALPEHPAKE